MSEVTLMDREPPGCTLTVTVADHGCIYRTVVVLPAVMSLKSHIIAGYLSLAVMNSEYMKQKNHRWCIITV